MTGATAVIVVMALGLRVMRLIRVLARSARLSWRRCATWIGGGGAGVLVRDLDTCTTVAPEAVLTLRINGLTQCTIRAINA